jgi:hypothetical protein
VVKGVGGGCGAGSRDGRSSCIISRVRGVGMIEVANEMENRRASGDAG